MLKLCQPPDPNPRQPKLKCPPAAADCHFHIYGPHESYPALANKEFGVPDALPHALRHLHDVLGIGRAVLIQPSGYGFDNSRQLTALAEMHRPGRVIVAVPLDVADDELKRLDAAGACGARFAVGHGHAPSFADIRRFADRLAPLGWHLDFHIRRRSDEPVLIAAERILRDLPVPAVIAHFASIPAAGGIDQPDFQLLCELVRAGHCWVKLSAACRITSQGPPYRDVAPLARALVAARPDRLIWGSDWPHVNQKGTMPNTTELLDCLLEWIPDASIRNRILADNPAVLYRF